MASEVKKRGWLVRTPAERVPAAETDDLAQRVIDERPNAIAYVGPHGEYWYDCVLDSIVDFEITYDVDLDTIPACWSATEDDARLERFQV